MKRMVNLVFVVLLSLFSCNKKEYEGKNSIENVKYNKNTTTYPSAKMDSIQAVKNIVKQKIQELFDLSVLYASGNKDTEIDSVIYDQMRTYFLDPDSLKLKHFILPLDSFRVNYTKVEDLRIEERIEGGDTLNLVKFDVNYYDSKKKYLKTHNREAQYVLKKRPVKFKKEFKFYFVDFD